MPRPVNYPRRLAIIAICLLGGFAIVVVDTWALITDPGDSAPMAIWLARRIPLATGVAMIAFAFWLLRQPVANDPNVAPDDIENMDGA